MSHPSSTFDHRRALGGVLPDANVAAPMLTLFCGVLPLFYVRLGKELNIRGPVKSRSLDVGVKKIRAPSSACRKQRIGEVVSRRHPSDTTVAESWSIQNGRGRQARLPASPYSSFEEFD